MPDSLGTTRLAHRALVLLLPGTTRDADLANAIELAGGDPQAVPIRALDTSAEKLDRYTLLALPGGFAAEDTLTSGHSWAQDMLEKFCELLSYFIEKKKAVLGIGNGFRALVNAGALQEGERTTTIASNMSGRYERHWVRLEVNPANSSPWLKNLHRLECPASHEAGRFVIMEDAVLPESRVAMYYLSPGGVVAAGAFPDNPFGSQLDIAALTNGDGNVLGIMPNPENHVLTWQHPYWTRGYESGLCLKLFENGLRAF